MFAAIHNQSPQITMILTSLKKILTSSINVV